MKTHAAGLAAKIDQSKLFREADRHIPSGPVIAPTADPLLASNGAGMDANKILASIIKKVSSPQTIKLDLQKELDILITSFEQRYAPLNAKKQTIGLDWAAVKDKYRAKVATVKDVQDFYFLLAQMLAELNDAHVSIELPSTLTYSLPLQMSYVENKFIVNFIAAKGFPESARKPDVGDELVAINGMSPEAFQKSSPIYNKFGNDLTNKAMFARMLSSMSEARGVPLSQMPQKVALTFRSSKDGQTFTNELSYAKNGIGIIGRPVAPGMTLSGFASQFEEAAVDKELALLAGNATSELSASEKSQLQQAIKFFHAIHEMVGAEARLPVQVAMNESAAAGEGQLIAMGHPKPLFALPSDFEEVKPPTLAQLPLNSDSFFAGTFERNGKKVGLLRIPSYMPNMILTIPFSIRYYIARLEEECDELIIDQMNNPGGAVAMSDLLIKALVGQLDPQKHMTFAVNPSQHFLRQFATLVEEVKKNQGGFFTPEQQERFVKILQADYDKVHKAYVNGQDLSDPISLATFSELMETMLDSMAHKIPWLGRVFLNYQIGADVFSHQTFTKPVHFLINELNFSGGDATPAGFQDYGRGKLVGVKTAGAGGTVEEFSQRTGSEFKYRVTTSLMKRKDGGLVENVAVKPDVGFSLTVEDYRNGMVNVLYRLCDVLGI